MNRYPDPFTLERNARELRREALSGIAEAAAVKWRALVGRLPHAPHPRQVPAPAHP